MQAHFGGTRRKRAPITIMAAVFGCAVLASAVVLALSSHVLARGPQMADSLAFPFGPSLEAAGWKTIRFPGRAPASFTAQGSAALKVETTGGVGLLWRPVPANFAQAEHASWRWRKLRGVGPTDLSRKGGDDRILAVYFAFADPRERRATVDLERLLRSGRGNVLTYVWGGAARAGTVQKLPYFGGRGRIIVKRPAATKAGSWFMEEAALATDFKRAFGKSPGRLIAVAISSDADDTGGHNLASLADLYVK